MKMKKVYLEILLVSVVLAGILGCRGDDWAFKTGYLSDYSKLQSVSDSSYRYLDSSATGKYKGFILDTVEVRLQPYSKGAIAESEGKLTQQDINDIKTYFHSEIINAIDSSGCKIEYKPDEGIARIRIAITDLRPTRIAAPAAHVIAGTGTGGAAIEAEILDSVSGKQVAAVVETQGGSRAPLSELNKWGGAKSAIDTWVTRFKKDLQDLK
jgi:hypothetical protein